VIAVERAGSALATSARHENRRYAYYQPDQQVVGQYAEAFSGLRGKRG
jgi:hypothetical protein